MSAYITVIEDNNNVLVVRTSDWQVIARCGSTTFANTITNSLNG